MLSEYIEGSILSQRLTAGDPIPYQEAMQIAEEVATALEAGHAQGVSHLGLNPGNIVLCTDGVRLVNYGYSQLARLAKSPSRSDHGDHLDYLSPEQLAGETGGNYSDLYSLGTILYEMLTGHIPGVGRLQHASEINLQVTEAIDVFIDHARERYPSDRFSSAKDMRLEINRITLASMNNQPSQYLRAGLTWVSNIYEKLVTGRSLLVLLPAMVILLVISIISSLPPGIRLGARLLFPLLLNSLLVSTLFDWAVRAIARQRGLGSLISSGRGMGAILGLAFTVYMISSITLEAIRLESLEDILSDFAGQLALNLFLTAISLGIILIAARVTERWWQRYTLGFYVSFVVIVFIVLAVSIIGLINPCWKVTTISNKLYEPTCP